MGQTYLISHEELLSLYWLQWATPPPYGRFRSPWQLPCLVGIFSSCHSRALWSFLCFPEPCVGCLQETEEQLALVIWPSFAFWDSQFECLHVLPPPEIWSPMMEEAAVLDSLSYSVRFYRKIGQSNRNCTVSNYHLMNSFPVQFKSIYYLS